MTFDLKSITPPMKNHIDYLEDSIRAIHKDRKIPISVLLSMLLARFGFHRAFAHPARKTRAKAKA